MSSSSHADRPERSRNAKAQARHRAKRKAYIEQLEQTVTKLQQAAGYSPEQINAMPPPLLKIRELEQENARLEKENEELRRLLTDSTSPHSRFSSETLRRPSVSPYTDFRSDRDYKRRKPVHPDGLYLSPGDTPHHGNEVSVSRPPPLSIPQPLSHHYGGGLGSSAANHNQHAPMFNLPNPGFQMPNTPSGSSATSSPSFSPVQIQPPLQASIDHRSHLSDHHAIPNNYTHSSHYAPVKVEDDHYMPTHHNAIHYPYSQNHNGQAGIDWHAGYSSERGHLR